MKFPALLCLAALWAGAAIGAGLDEIKDRKVYQCRYVENPPQGAVAWSQSDFVKNSKNRESRFIDYNSDAANELVLDATAERDVSKAEGATPRSTSFFMTYNEKGWHIYIESEEPLVKNILDALVDPTSPGHLEQYEVFFAPGLHSVPYYQLMTKPYRNETDFVDWGIPHRYYRSLKPFAKIDSVPLEHGIGTSIVIPWEAVHNFVPLNGEYWRFSIIRWMPFAKAGGVTWGGKVHNTGNFGFVHFQPPTPAQKALIEKRLLRAAWFTFLAKSKIATTYWNDEKTGDVEFFQTVLHPEIARLTEIGQSLGNPDDWTSEAVANNRERMEEWMEFNYTVSDLRTQYLEQKRFAEK